MEKITNEEVLRRMGTGRGIVRQFKTRKLHLIRHNTSQLQLMEGNIEGRRSCGRSRTTWITDLANSTGAKYYQLKRAAEDGKGWHDEVVNLAQKTTPPPTWRVHEVEVDEIVDAEFLELEYDGAEITPEYLRVRLLLHLVDERLLRVQAEALARLRAAGSPRPLLGARLTNGRHEQRFDSDARVVHLSGNDGREMNRVLLKK